MATSSFDTNSFLAINSEHLRSLAREAELYRTQGLLEHSKVKYLQILQFIEEKQFSNHRKLIDAVRNKLETLEENLAAEEQDTSGPRLSQKHQNMIKDLFSVSQTREAAKIEGAVALAEFGQYERALEEFHTLLKEGTLPVVAAKNILRCHMELSCPDDAVAQFREWVVSGDVLTPQELKLIRAFIENLLQKKGIKRELPHLADTSPSASQSSEDEEGFLDISSVYVELGNGPRKGDMVEFQVTSQSGNTISVNIPGDQRDLLDAFRPGLQLPELQCYSPIAVFKGKGIVMKKRKIWHGRNEGNYLLDITIDEE
jgi:tetratricopeptide (TPR) repeat protein